MGPKRVVQLDPCLRWRWAPALPVTLRELVGAYGTIANGGHFVEPMVVLRVEDRDGQVLSEFQPVREAVETMPRA